MSFEDLHTIAESETTPSMETAKQAISLRMAYGKAAARQPKPATVSRKLTQAFAF